METAGVCAEATGTAATEKARTIAATVGVRISVSFTRNPSQREDERTQGRRAARSRDMGARPCRRLGRRGRERAELARVEVIDMDRSEERRVGKGGQAERG